MELGKSLNNRFAQINWLRVFATVFCSNLFFIGSCTLGMVGTDRLLDDPDDYGPEITEDYQGPSFTSVVATVPDLERPGQRKKVLVFTQTLEEFMAKNPDYSFMLPLGEGNLDNPDVEMWTNYVVKASSDGKVIVESKFHHNVPPAGVDVRQRYEATNKDIKMLNAEFSPGLLMPIIFGMIFASVVRVTGRILKRHDSRINPTSIPMSDPHGTAPIRPLLVSLGLVGLKTRKTVLAFMWICIGLAAVSAILRIWFGLIILLPAFWYWYAVSWIDKHEGWK